MLLLDVPLPGLVAGEGQVADRVEVAENEAPVLVSGLQVLQPLLLEVAVRAEAAAVDMAISPTLTLFFRN